MKISTLSLSLSLGVTGHSISEEFQFSVEEKETDWEIIYNFLSKLDTIDGWLMDRQSNCIDDNGRVSPNMTVYPWLMCKKTVVSVSLTARRQVTPPITRTDPPILPAAGGKNSTS